MDKILNSLPKPVLAILAIGVALIFFMFNDPPHSVCDVQIGNLKEDLKGQVFPSVVDKHNLPPMIGRAQEGCQLGNSAGSCFEYFSILKKVARNIQNYSSECRTELSSTPEIRKAMTDGITLMGLMAWGSKPPDPGLARVGWMQESELVLFCQLKNVYSLSFGNEAWEELRLKVFHLLPGANATSSNGAPVPGAGDAPKAMLTMGEKEIWARSIFSIRCENYR